jgi:hypothetical protein
MTRPNDSLPRSSGPRRAVRDDLLSPATQIVADRDAYLGQGRHDVGRRIADDQVELFVAADAAASLEREFEQQQSEFIALHDLGTSASLRLLAGLAGAAGAPVQRLEIRRQGHGVALAVLPFVEVLLADRTTVRVYSTDLDCDDMSRQPLARVLLAWSKLGVLMVGDLAGPRLAAALRPLREAMTGGPWVNREMLIVPLGASAALAAQGRQLTVDTPVSAHVSPRAAGPNEVWSFVAGSWNRLHGRPGGERRVETDIERAVPAPAVPWSQVSTEPMPLDDAGGARSDPVTSPWPPAPLAPAAALAARPMPKPGGMRWQAYAERCAAIKGAIASCVFDLHSMKPLASAGGPPKAERLAEQGAAMLGAMGVAARTLGVGAERHDLALSTASHHLLLRPLPGHPGVALHLVLLASGTNPMLARMQLDRIDVPA